MLARGSVPDPGAENWPMPQTEPCFVRMHGRNRFGKTHPEARMAGTQGETGIGRKERGRRRSNMEAFVFANWMWLVLMVVLLVIEGLTVNLTTIWFATGALVAFLLGLAGVPIGWQVAAFLVVAVIMVVFTRPVAVKYLKVGRTRTNVDSMVGREGIVIKSMTELQTGQVKVGGAIWTALPKNGQSLAEGTVITVAAVEGVKLLVLPAQGPDILQ